MAKPYEYTDTGGDTFRVETYTAQEVEYVSLAYHLAGESTSVDVPAADVPAVAADIHRAMMRAAGHPEPIILERPDDREVVKCEIYAEGGHVEVYIHGCYAPEPARRLAAFIAHTADEAEQPSPAPGVVKDLADVIYGTDPPRITHDMAQAIAEALLRAGYTREGD